MSQRGTTIDTFDRYMSNSDATKAVLNSPCVDRYNGKCLSRDNSKAVISDKFGRPKGENRKRNANNNGNKGNNKGAGNGGGNNQPKKPKNGQAGNVSAFSKCLSYLKLN